MRYIFITCFCATPPQTQKKEPTRATPPVCGRVVGRRASHNSKRLPWTAQLPLKWYRQGSDGKPASIRHAKRCPAPVSTHDSGSAYLVALSLDNSAVLFFLCPSQAGEEPLQVREFAKFKCAPNTLRFREEFYPISSFYWTGPLQDDIPPSDHGRARHREPSPPSVVVSSLWYEELGGNFPRHSGLGDPWCPPSCRVLLCVTSISIDVVKVQCGVAGEDSLVLLCRYPTHTDYWHYCSPARAILSVNKLKPCSVKVLLVTSDVGLYRLPPLWLEENQMIATEDEQDPLPSLVPFAACMDPPATRYPLALLELYHQLFVCSMSRHAQGAVLFRYHLPPEGGECASDACFVAHAVLRFDFMLDIKRDPVVLQVVDNVVVLHALRQGLSSAFDVLLGEVEESQGCEQGHGGNSSSLNDGRGRSFEEQFHFGTPNDVETLAHMGNGRSASWMWFSWLTNRLHTGVMERVAVSGGCDLRGKSSLPLFRPLLSAALTPHPHQNGAPMGSDRGDAVYSQEFVLGGLPLLLDRWNGTVRLVWLNPFPLAAVIPRPSRRVQFYLNRMYCAGNVVQSLLYTMLSKMEPLADVGQALEVVATHYSMHEQCVKASAEKRDTPDCSFDFTSPGTHSEDTVANAHGTRCCKMPCMGDVVASPTSLRDGADGQPQESSLCCTNGYLTTQDVLSACTISCTPLTGRALAADRTIGQFSMEREVFAPLADTVISSDKRSAAILTVAAVNEDSAVTEFHSLRTCIDSCGKVHFARYLFYALMEYARCVMQTGLPLSDGLQNILMRLMPHAAAGSGSLQKLLFPAVISDQLPRAIRLVNMGGEWRQRGVDMLVRMRADTLVIQVLLVEKRLLEAARYLCAVELRNKEETGSSERLISSQLMGDVFQSAVEGVLEEEQRAANSCGESGGGVNTRKRGKKALEFMVVYEILTSCLLQLSNAEKAVPPQFAVATAKYEQLLLEGITW
ncbi:hypothetical protein TRVL_02204 [Trypanosoma vivax]|nr:hypothetical protein TRVL_02204 [Trypanosoma vivax]